MNYQDHLLNRRKILKTILKTLDVYLCRRKEGGRKGGKEEIGKGGEEGEKEKRRKEGERDYNY